jgi:glycerate kinase
MYLIGDGLHGVAFSDEAIYRNRTVGGGALVRFLMEKGALQCQAHEGLPISDGGLGLLPI